VRLELKASIQRVNATSGIAVPALQPRPDEIAAIEFCDFNEANFDGQTTHRGFLERVTQRSFQSNRRDYVAKMLKSTYKPSGQVNAIAPLPTGWTEHKAPTGQLHVFPLFPLQLQINIVSRKCFCWERVKWCLKYMYLGLFSKLSLPGLFHS
jgi:hypothetical protein